MHDGNQRSTWIGGVMAAAIIILAGCASVPETLVEAPYVSLNRVEVQRLDLDSQTVLLGFDVTMMSVFGFFGLSGIVINDSIILVTINTEVGPAYGVALLAAVGAGEFKNIQEACKATIYVEKETAVDRKAKSVYDKAFPVYQQLYPSLKDDFKAIAGL